MVYKHNAPSFAKYQARANSTNFSKKGMGGYWLQDGIAFAKIPMAIVRIIFSPLKIHTAELDLRKRWRLNGGRIE